MSLPPVVEPGPPLTRDQATRYARHLLIPDVGELGQRRLAAARVCVLGAGGLGSPALLYLAAAGVGTIGVIDPDVVEASNLQRQVVHGQDDLGRLKVDSVRDRLAQVNPLVDVVTHPVRLDSGNARQLLAGYDVVVDGTDTFATRYLVNDACVLLGVPCVWGSVLRFDGRASVFWGRRGPCYRCLFPQPPPAGSVPSCAQAGVLGLLCGAIGAVQGTEVVKLVTGIGEPLVGRLLVHDALRASWQEIVVRADPRCDVCGDVPTIVSDDQLGRTGAPDRRASSDEVSALPAVDATELAELLAERDGGGRDLLLIDVREAQERAVDQIAGSWSMPVGLFDSGAALSQVPFDRPVVLHCAAGSRSARALRVLLAAGHPAARHLEGGIIAWRDRNADDA
ncbi:MAG: molybdopterin-synthase adenylyltransferase MoeB [Angustibacter sp.]